MSGGMQREPLHCDDNLVRGVRAISDVSNDSRGIHPAHL